MSGPSGVSLSRDLAVAGGRVYWPFWYTDDVDLGPQRFSAPAGSYWQSVLVAFDSSSGAVGWTRPLDSDLSFRATGVAAGSLGPYVSAVFQGTTTLNGSSFASIGDDDTLTIALTTTGAVRWARQLSSTSPGSHVAAWAIAADGSGPIIVGALNGARVLAYDTAGAARWSRAFGDTSATKVGIDSMGRAYVYGRLEGTVDFGTGPVTATSPAASYLVSLNASGGTRWVRLLDGDLGLGNDIHVAPDGTTYLATTLGSSPFDFGGGPLASLGGCDLALASYDAGGGHRWSRRFGSSEDERGQGIVADGLGRVIAAGTFWSFTDLGGGRLEAPGGPALFVTELRE